jgi:hypothetical protein
MSLSLKPGVRLGGLQPQIVLAALVIEDLYEELRVQCVVTSCNDGTHKSNSKHYSGNALDFRTKTVPRGLLMGLVASVKASLGTDFDVILESINGDNEHLHVEFDPKGAAPTQTA